MNKWLEDFAYRISIQWWFFAVAGLLTLLIALVTISAKTIQAAIANPVDALRNE
jgi:putative ABC transport system permease protein